MNTKRQLLWATAALLGMSSLSAQATPSAPDLFEYDLNIDGIVSSPTFGDPIPAGVDVSLFNDLTGLGTITATITGLGSHTFDAFFDHDVGAVTGLNEIGMATGVAAAGQSWEIDEPFSGDIFDNFLNSTLDNSVGLPIPEDLSMAMGWDFTLGLGETAEISLLLSDTLPVSGFYLTQENIVHGESNYDFYLSSTISITGGQPEETVPEPSMLLLLGIGLAGMMVTRRKDTV